MIENIKLNIPDDLKEEYCNIKASSDNWGREVLNYILVGKTLDLKNLEDYEKSALKEYRRQVDKSKLFSMAKITFQGIEEFITFGKFATLVRGKKK